MFCGKCGSTIPDGDTFCSVCGAPISVSPDMTSSYPNAQPIQTAPVIMSSQPMPAKRTNGVAIAGFVLGIFAFLFCLVPVVGMVLGIVGLILSIIGISKKKTCSSGGGLAITGLILSIFGVMGLIMMLGINAYSNKAQAATSQSVYESTVDPQVDAVNQEIDKILYG